MEQTTSSENQGITHSSIYLGDFIVESGQTLSHLEIAYEKTGNKNNPIILVCHALTGNQFSVGTTESPGWWSEFIGPGLFVDTDKFQVITMNVLGGCSGSTGPTCINRETNQPYMGDFPNVTVRDMVKTQYLALQKLGIKHVHAIIGGSLGGMQVFEWGIMYPTFANMLIPIASTPYLSDYAMAYNTIAKQAIINDPRWNGGHYNVDEPIKGLELARMIGMVTYRSDHLFNARFKRQLKSKEEFQIESYLKYQGEKLAKRFDANSYLRLLTAMDYHDIGQGRNGWEQALQTIEAKVLLISYTGDLLYPSHAMKEVAEQLAYLGKEVSFFGIDTQFGHDGFLVEFNNWAYLVKNAIESGDVKEVGPCQPLMLQY
ncbi:homoserine O-acetyltransferase MetX [Bacillus sp. Marseille-P3661]|uniref:homoserine O-acetyltransferase MetX n=1 Tax=Bacillus sp. Marseille-P3661 TaxID=1936234 RepID=UPI0021553E4D|nr:homoserine O-acetyltransferase [Bacillus sp. Marseille-P3661]